MLSYCALLDAAQVGNTGATDAQAVVSLGRVPPAGIRTLTFESWETPESAGKVAVLPWDLKCPSIVPQSLLPPKAHHDDL